ncbi:uncharacterized protein K452DRAFT_64681 [Aplosporella prunicola CBS 121167]|uniref:Uncharacterized protein n=1 Tax=Aplosporella prunicola CBS 121167 TaxID=1176127 RepID=A0A6A6B8V4_9PEZI|nr:uncharacterized protein K452DRAFT_64681 [Aplosporella prunicola CBS 121167]KAF2139725.1 hypothetical protein K452DRAFT_64681 [Aplosporella prunicola CBS 121167]
MTSSRQRREESLGDKHGGWAALINTLDGLALSTSWASCASPPRPIDRRPAPIATLGPGPPLRPERRQINLEHSYEPTPRSPPLARKPDLQMHHAGNDATQKASPAPMRPPWGAAMKLRLRPSRLTSCAGGACRLEGHSLHVLCACVVSQRVVLPARRRLPVAVDAIPASRHSAPALTGQPSETPPLRSSCQNPEPELRVMRWTELTAACCDCSLQAHCNRT